MRMIDTYMALMFFLSDKNRLRIIAKTYKVSIAFNHGLKITSVLKNICTWYTLRSAVWT